MRLWTLHPRYLDAKGLLALWREGLLAQKVLKGETRGYTHHPQLERFRRHADPVAALATYLSHVHEEAQRRGYSFDAGKIEGRRTSLPIPVTRGQLVYEWNHLLEKLQARDRARYLALQGLACPEPHPLFVIVEGDVEAWEVRKSA